MKILLAHNRYASRGGEDTVFDRERDLLRAYGHEVLEYTRENQTIGAAGKIRLAIGAVWSDESYKEVKQLMERMRPDVLHVHNTLPLISPAIYYAASACKVPVVQTLHNYRLLCANAMLVRNSVVCEDCVGKTIAWPGILHKCYRGDRGASISVVGTVAVHRLAGTWRRKVARYIALCEFARGKLLASGLPEDRVVVKPNFAVDRQVPTALSGPKSGALFVGRLSEEKGLRVLFEAWRDIEVDLGILGSGLMESELRAKASSRVRFLGFSDDAGHIFETMRRASFIVMPSLVYENFPMIVAEAFSAGTPIIASRLGALAELVEDGVTGLHFNPADAADLASKVRWADAHPDQMAQMGQHARRRYEQSYTPEANYSQLIQIYGEAKEVVSG